MSKGQSKIQEITSETVAGGMWTVTHVLTMFAHNQSHSHGELGGSCHPNLLFAPINSLTVPKSCGWLMTAVVCCDWWLLLYCVVLLMVLFYRFDSSSQQQHWDGLSSLRSWNTLSLTCCGRQPNPETQPCMTKLQIAHNMLSTCYTSGGIYWCCCNASVVVNCCGFPIVIVVVLSVVWLRGWWKVDILLTSCLSLTLTPCSRPPSLCYHLTLHVSLD